MGLRKSAVRSIIQIAIEPATEDSSAYLYALCDDGTIWEQYPDIQPGGSYKKAWAMVDTHSVTHGTGE